MSAQVLIATGEIALGVGVEVLVSGRERVTAMLRRYAAQLPQRILQMFGQGTETLAAKDDCCIFPATAGEAEMIKPMIEALAGNGGVQLLADGKSDRTCRPIS